MVIAQDGGNRFNESHLAATLARLEAQHGDPLAALEYSAVAIRHLHDSGNSTTIRGPLATLAAFLDRLGRYEPAATIAGFASTPMTAIGFRELGTAITHLRDVLGDQTYESLARKGETGADAGCAIDELQARRSCNQTTLLDTERVGQGCVLASPAFERIAQPPSPRMAGGPRPYGSATLGSRPGGALSTSVLAVTGITNKSLRALMTGLLGGATYTRNQASYDLARLRVNGRG